MIRQATYALLLLILLVTACVSPAPTPFASPAATFQASVTPSPPFPSPTATATPGVTPGTTVEVDCTDVAPFAPGCLDQPRPPELGPDVEFIGILPAGPAIMAAWSPDGTHLAYAVVNPDGWSGVEIRQGPEFGLVGRWEADFVSDLTWTPDGLAVLFVFERGDTSSIGLVRLGETGWHDLLPGDKAHLAVSLGKSFVDWLSENVLAFRVHCGTGCETLYALDITTGKLSPLVNSWGSPDALYADVFATVYLFSPDQRWVAAISWGAGLPRAMVLEWPGPAEPFDISAHLDNRYTEAQSWTDRSLAFVAYPTGEPDSWPLPPRPDLYIWDANTGAMRRVASSALRAVFGPTGDRLAVLFVGRPWVDEEGRVESDGSVAHLGLLNWPEGQLLTVQPVSAEGVGDVFDMWRLPTPIWSPDGEQLIYWGEDDNLWIMRWDGTNQQRLTDGLDIVEAVWSPEGSRLAITTYDQLWIIGRPSR